MTFFTASFEIVLIRYFIMMAVIVASFSFGYPVISILGFFIFLTAITAVSFKTKDKQTKQQKLTKETKELRRINTAA